MVGEDGPAPGVEQLLIFYFGRSWLYHEDAVKLGQLLEICPIREYSLSYRQI